MTSIYSPQLRKTKIVATIGPASDSPDVIEGMINAGMNVARLNLSFGTFEEHKERLDRIRSAADRLDANIATMIDTKGIEVRTGEIKGESINLSSGNNFSLYMDGRLGDEAGVSVSYRQLAEEVVPGIPILLDDGAIELEVKSVSADTISCRVVHGGALSKYKSVNLPDTELSFNAVTPESRAEVINELNFAAENEIEYIAASFIQNAQDVYIMQSILAEKGATIPIIAKIENKAGVSNLDAIVDAADGIMVARGDLGVELPLADVPGKQKEIIRKTVTNGKPVITATQMLASMERNPKPTRAEASDVANAILDGTSAVMLSGETAIGKYPVVAIKMMASLALRAEAYLPDYGYLQNILPHPSSVVTEAVSQAAISMATHLKAAVIISLTSRGFTSRLISKHRPDCPILAITTSEMVARRLSMNWGVIPMLYKGESGDKAKIHFAIARAEALGYVRAGDIVLATAGQSQIAGGTDMIRVITVEK